MGIDQDRIVHLEELCSQEYGPQEIFLTDPYEDATTVLYESPESLTTGQLLHFVHEYNGVWPFCSDIALLRMLPAILGLWQSALSSTRSIEETLWPQESAQHDLVCGIYCILHSRQLLRRRLPDAVNKATTDVIVEALLSRSREWSLGFEETMPIGGDNLFVRHWNSCIAILASAAPLWESFWRLDTKSLILEAAWLIQAFAGGRGENKGAIVDTRDLSEDFVHCCSSEAPYWSDETRRFFVNDARVAARLGELTNAIENSGPELKQCKSWPAISACAMLDSATQATITRRFLLNVNLMCAGKNGWSAWQEVECGEVE